MVTDARKGDYTFAVTCTAQKPKDQFLLPTIAISSVAMFMLTSLSSARIALRVPGAFSLFLILLCISKHIEKPNQCFMLAVYCIFPIWSLKKRFVLEITWIVQSITSIVSRAGFHQE